MIPRLGPHLPPLNSDDEDDKDDEDDEDDENPKYTTVSKNTITTVSLHKLAILQTLIRAARPTIRISTPSHFCSAM